jgi:Protein of unknown function (DUF3147)
MRFALGAAVSVIAGVLSLTIGARFGGTFLAFPSILPASLTLIQQEEGTRRADHDATGAAAGSVGLLVFAMTGEAAFGRVQPFGALALALAGWAICSFALYGMLAYVRRDGL